VDARAEAGAQVQHRARIGDAFNRSAGVVGAQPVLGHHLAQALRVRRFGL
jgi:hypothetical protein